MIYIAKLAEAIYVLHAFQNENFLLQLYRPPRERGRDAEQIIVCRRVDRRNRFIAASVVQRTENPAEQEETRSPYH